MSKKTLDGQGARRGRGSPVSTGQVDLLGNIHGLEKLVVKPEVVQQDGLKVIHFAISEEDKKINNYLETVLKEARKLEPEVKSRGRPAYLTSGWQVRQRKKKAGLI